MSDKEVEPIAIGVWANTTSTLDGSVVVSWPDPSKAKFYRFRLFFADGGMFEGVLPTAMYESVVKPLEKKAYIIEVYPLIPQDGP